MQPYAIGIISPDESLIGRLWATLNRPGVHMGWDTDPRAIKRWLGEGPVDLIVLDASLSQPSSTHVAEVLYRATAGKPPLVHLVQSLPSGSPSFAAEIRRDVHPRIIADRLIHIAHETRVANADDPELRAEVELRMLRGGELNHYEVLDLPASATGDAIKAAYDRLSLQLHPDRVRRVGDETVRTQASELYARIQEAYEVLRNGAERARYNRELKGRAVASSRVDARVANLNMESWAVDPAARRALRTAQQALNAGDTIVALSQLEFALVREPDNELIVARLAEIRSTTNG